MHLSHTSSVAGDLQLRDENKTLQSNSASLRSKLVSSRLSERLSLPRGKKIYIAILSVLLVSFLLSLVTWLLNYPGERKVFIFNSLDTGGLIVESRFLSEKPVQGNETLFVDELLIGPLTERCLPLFSDGTKSLSVFEKDGVFYANISAHALSELAGVENIKDGADLFQKNILWNFSGVKTVELYIDSKKAY